MCGIAGWSGRAPLAAERLWGMKASLAHRGPDGMGDWISGNTALGHTRLAIIDPDHGQQPLVRGDVALVGNGEIYNDPDLRKLLTTPPPTGSDFEPLAITFQGPETFDQQRGMYTAAVTQDGNLWLARDPFGIKPLYVSQTDEGLAFASEPRALLAGGFAEADVNLNAAHQALCVNYTVGETTLWSGITRLPPGARWHFRDGEVIHQRQIPAWPEPEPTPKSEDEALKRFDAIMADSVAVHMRSDVPYGLFLSGGVDSSLIATLSARLAGEPITTFTCGFAAEGAKDERDKARRVAEALNLNLHEVEFTEDDFWTLLPQAMWALDDLLLDPACLPTFKLAQAAKRDMTVVLTGEGGDELFAGYGRYRRALRPWWLGGRMAQPQGAFKTCGFVLRQPTAQAQQAWRQVADMAPSFRDRLQQAQARDVATWLPSDLLLKLDRMLMAHSLEGRTPFLDPHVAAFAQSLPPEMKIEGRRGKWLLRQWLAKHCPEAEPFAKKQGFTVPLYPWLAAKKEILSERLSQNPFIAEVAKPDAVKVLIDNMGRPQAQAVYNLLGYAVWRRIHETGLMPAGSALDLLDR